MKKFSLLVFVLFFGNLDLWGQDCLPFGITFSTQAEIDNFPINYPGCTKISGSVLIGSNYLTPIDISNVNALAQITFIKGGLTVGFTNLSNLDGLDNIDTIRGELRIFDNSVLTNLGFNMLKSVKTIRVWRNPLLESLNDFKSVKYLDELQITDNENLIELDAFDNLNSVKILSISEHPKLKSLQNFKTLLNVDRLEIQYNAELESLSGFDSTQVNKFVYITDNYKLVNLVGLGNIDSVGKIDILSNTGLQNLNGLNKLFAVGSIQIDNSPELVNLNGLNNLTIINDYLLLSRNSVLASLDALQNLAYIGSDLYIYENPLLSNCAISAICNFIAQSTDNTHVYNNAPGCATSDEIEKECGVIPVLSNVLIDNDGNCLPDTIGIPVSNIQVRLDGASQTVLRPTQSDGIVHFGYLDSGPFLLHLPQFPTINWSVCQDTFHIDPDISPDTITRTFLLKPNNQCPELSIKLGLPPSFRGCLITTPARVSVQNVGTITAENVVIAVVMPSELDLVSSIPPLLVQNGDTLFFAVGDVAPFGLATVNMTVKTDCDTFLLGQALCIEAFAALDNPCSNGPSFSEIRLFSQCVNDTTVRFTLKNVGNAATQSQHEYVIIEDEIVMLTAPFALNSYESMTVDVPTDGSTYRMEATKYDNGAQTATVRENCGGFTPGFVTAYWFDRSLRSYDFDCREVNLAYDPNEKTAIPTGIGPAYLIVANHSMEYTIEFQNTGTDTAFRVLLRDTLSSKLNLNTFQPGFSSHPYTWEIRENGKLEVLFSPIILPDSNVNEAASHGFFSFTIDQMPDLPDGTVLENTASIIFDYNPPIITNTVVHTIGQLTVSADEPQRFTDVWQVLGNPTRVSATFRAKELIAGIKRFELTDALSRIVRTEQFAGQSLEFQRGTLPGGVYFFRIADAKGRVFTGKIVVAE